jgi:hypothetical protein
MGEWVALYPISTDWNPMYFQVMKKLITTSLLLGMGILSGCVYNTTRRPPVTSTTTTTSQGGVFTPGVTSSTTETHSNNSY